LDVPFLNGRITQPNLPLDALRVRYEPYEFAFAGFGAFHALNRENGRRFGCGCGWVFRFVFDIFLFSVFVLFLGFCRGSRR
jgi:hypothetical protein